MMYKVIKAFKCRHKKFKVFNEGNEYKSVNKDHTEKLVKLGYIKEVPKKKASNKTSAKKQEKKEDEKDDKK